MRLNLKLKLFYIFLYRWNISQLKFHVFQHPPTRIDEKSLVIKSKHASFDACFVYIKFSASLSSRLEGKCEMWNGNLNAHRYLRRQFNQRYCTTSRQRAARIRNSDELRWQDNLKSPSNLQKQMWEEQTRGKAGSSQEIHSSARANTGRAKNCERAKENLEIEVEISEFEWDERSGRTIHLSSVHPFFHRNEILLMQRARTRTPAERDDEGAGAWEDERRWKKCNYSGEW